MMVGPFVQIQCRRGRGVHPQAWWSPETGWAGRRGDVNRTRAAAEERVAVTGWHHADVVLAADVIFVVAAAVASRVDAKV